MDKPSDPYSIEALKFWLEKKCEQIIEQAKADGSVPQYVALVLRMKGGKIGYVCNCAMDTELCMEIAEHWVQLGKETHAAIEEASKAAAETNGVPEKKHLH